MFISLCPGTGKSMLPVCRPQTTGDGRHLLVNHGSRFAPEDWRHRSCLTVGHLHTPGHAFPLSFPLSASQISVPLALCHRWPEHSVHTLAYKYCCWLLAAAICHGAGRQPLHRAVVRRACTPPMLTKSVLPIFHGCTPRDSTSSWSACTEFRCCISPRDP